MIIIICTLVPGVSRKGSMACPPIPFNLINSSGMHIASSVRQFMPALVSGVGPTLVSCNLEKTLYKNKQANKQAKITDC